MSARPRIRQAFVPRKSPAVRLLPPARSTSAAVKDPPQSATPSISGAKPNKAFCIKTGTTVTFTSSSKDTGFVLDFGASNPFDHQGAVMGGADRPVTVTAKHPGCYTYSVGACTAGTVYGMCGEDVAQLIISNK